MTEIVYRKMYTQLFNGVTNALVCIAKEDYYGAMALLKEAKRETEQTFILWEENKAGEE